MSNDIYHSDESIGSWSKCRQCDEITYYNPPPNYTSPFFIDLCETCHIVLIFKFLGWDKEEGEK